MLKPSQRLLSIDAFRALTMLAMIFVNDVSSVKNIPEWIDHVKAQDDGLGFADTVFPAFLFIVGLSIPFAIGKRISQQKSFLSTEMHILIRSLALIVMGFFHVNLESYSPAALLPYPLWELLITIGFFLVWLDYPADMDKRKRYALTGAGILLLAAMAYLYKGGPVEAPHWMEPSWWGILGIIGWAYLVCATLYLIVKGNFAAITVILGIFLLINILTHAGILHFSIPVINNASSVSLIMAGTVISSLYTLLDKKGKLGSLWSVFIGLGVLALLAAFILRPHTAGISKIRATPAWVLICSGISILMFTAMIWLVDVKGKMNWFKWIRPAGTSTLTCYLIPYLLYSLLMMVGFKYPSALSQGAGGILRSIAIAFLVILLVGWMEKKRVRLKI
jgi:predicted acyltransferase